MNPRKAFWPVRFARWGRPAHGPVSEPGYTLLLPVPGDLPVFLRLALAVCALQDPVYRVETLVLPDRLTPAVRQIVAEAAPHWPGPLRLVPLPPLDRVVLPRLADPHKNHGAQLIQGVRQARGERVLLHDADLFLTDPQVHADEYTLAAKEDLDVLGISPAWDPWYAGRGQQLVATWEQVARVTWFRSFPPYRHLGHDAPVDGEWHTFDTTFWPQLHTAADARAVGVGLAERTVHFNYTIGTYREFARRRQTTSNPFHDSNFRILLIRIFTELFGADDDGRGLPDLPDLAAGLGAIPGAGAGGAGDGPVRYAAEDGDAYRRLRTELARVVQGPWSSPKRSERCLTLLAAFDDYFGRP